ncbi:MAG: DUF4091 domain-containing protein, partial [Clostridiales bacterium]|nr:DUF4091 domain-containing protein [Clostridiales bacterium]
LLSSLTKVFLEEEPQYQSECMVLTALKGETVSFQAAYTCMALEKTIATIQVISPLKEFIHVRSVLTVPVGTACGSLTDDNYLKKISGDYPDLLRELKEDKIEIIPQKWKSIWIDIDITEDMKAGCFPIQICLNSEDGILCNASTFLTIYDVILPKQKTIHTEWMHADCLADYYRVPVFSEEHWNILGKFLCEYVKRGCNMILTPLFTPPLDTAVGGERTTIQLVEVTVNDGTYSFEFDRLKRWVNLCKECGMEYYEMSHLFSQWGAYYPPKIIAKVNGREEKIFGWHTPALGEYTKFLQVFLPQLIEKLKEWGIDKVTYFHLSDEPDESDLNSYQAAKESVEEFLKDFHTFDALSSYEFYRHGLVQYPIPQVNEVMEFLEHGVPDLWTYYCGCHGYKVSNRYMSMPSLRNRILGLQLYKYGIVGFLHWGYNFYNSQYSLTHINPYEITDAGGSFPSGDSFLVYPGDDGDPEESIRMMVLNEALSDIRACQLLESITNKAYVMELMEGELAMPITFQDFPKSDRYLLQLRNRINQEIAQRLEN